MIKSVIFAACICGVFSLSAVAEDWPVWRGPSLNGHAPASAKPPLTWSESENVIWKAKVPGRGHSSPIVVGDRIYMATADEQTEVQSVLCFDRSDGAQLWSKALHRGNFPKKIHKKNTHASATLSAKNGVLYAIFSNGGGIHLSAVSLDGDIKWQQRCGDWKGHYNFGYAPSPVLHGENVIVSSEYQGDGWIAAFSQANGDEVWRIARGDTTSYSSPIVATVSGREQLLISGLEKVSSYNPATGKLLWEVEGTTKATCGTMVWNGDTVFASGGFPDKQTIAVRADGSGEVLWTDNEKVYEQSMLVIGDHLYALNDGGIALCWNAETGDLAWKERLGGNVSSSPIFADGKIYAMNERGITYVFSPNSEKFEKLAENQLGDEGFATPVFLEDRIYIRTATQSGGTRQEWLYCIGEK